MQELSIERDGCTLRATVIDGPGIPVVMTHGALGVRPLAQAALANVLDKRPVVLLEVRGHGDSICRHLPHYTWANLTEDLDAWVEHLNLTRYTLVGQSLGTVVSLGHAVAHPNQVESLVLTRSVFLGEDLTPEPGHRAALERLAASFGTSGEPSAAQVISALEELDAGDPALLSQVLAMHRDLQSVASYFRLQDRGPLPYLSRQLGELAMPTLVLSGSDAVHPAEVSEQLATLLPWGELVSAAHVEPAGQLRLEEFLLS